MRNIDILIEKYHDKTGLSYIDSVLDFIEERDLELYDVKSYLSEDTLKKLRAEFIKKRVVKGEDSTRRSDILILAQSDVIK